MNFYKILKNYKNTKMVFRLFFEISSTLIFPTLTHIRKLPFHIISKNRSSNLPRVLLITSFAPSANFIFTPNLFSFFLPPNA